MATVEQPHADTARDSADLARFGYKQELKRTLGTFSSFAVAFSYISPSTGIFTLYALGLSFIGAAFFWTWPIVFLGQLFIALNFAELSSHFPVAGSVFQWTKYLTGRTYAWLTGWIYLAAGVLTVTAVVVTLPLALVPAFNAMGWTMENSLANQRLIAIVTLGLITVLNIYGVKLVAIVNNTGVLFEILGMVVFAIILALLHNRQGAGVIFDTGGQSVTFGTFTAAMFMSLFVIYGFDTASTLAEETRDPRREAPKAVLAAIIGAFIIGVIFLWGTLMAIPDLKDAIANGMGPAQIIAAAFSPAMATLYLLVVAAAIFVCCLSIMTSTIRLMFGMARDNQLPLSALLAKVNPSYHTPVGACIAVGLLAAIPLLQYAGAAYIAIAATGMIYLSYFLGNFAILRARLGGWPRVKSPFALGKWGIVVNVLGLVWGGSMLLNFAYPRACCNPRPMETVVGEVQLLNFHIGFLDRIPVLWTVFAVILLVGMVYYFAVQHKKPFTAIVPPDEAGPVK
jgi:urea carboxylase system permease